MDRARFRARVAGVPGRGIIEAVVLAGLGQTLATGAKPIAAPSALGVQGPIWSRLEVHLFKTTWYQTKSRRKGVHLGEGQMEGLCTEKPQSTQPQHRLQTNPS